MAIDTGYSRYTDYRNSKTALSFDLTTICPRLAAGKQCAYCYVEAARKAGLRGKTVREYSPYDGWILTIPDKLVKGMNSNGGLRFFSFSDYDPQHREDIRAALADCLTVGLKVKAITKVPMFVNHFHDHEAVSTIHVSIDNLGSEYKDHRSPITHARAQQMREKWPKVRVRAVCLNNGDLEYFGGLPWVDILTPNHAMNAIKNSHLFSKAERKEAVKKYPGRVCGAVDTCMECRTKCQYKSRV